MEKSRCRYTNDQLRSLGLSEASQHGVRVRFSDAEIKQEIDEKVKGKFKNIIDLLFSSKDGSLDNTIGKFLSENTPDDVKNFVNNFLMKPVSALPPAPDADTAFDMIIPRYSQTSSELAPYLDDMRMIVGKAFEAQQNNNSSNSD